MGVPIGPATRCDEMGHFPVILGFQKHRRPSQVSPKKSQQCGQSATHDGRFPFSPEFSIAGIAYRNI